MSLIRLLGFATVVLLALLLLHGYLWFRLVRSTTRPGRSRRRLTWLAVVLAVLPALAVTLRRTLPLDVAAPLDWIAYSWLGVAFYAFLALIVLEPVRLAGRLWLRRNGSTEVVPSGARTGVQAGRGHPEWGPRVRRSGAPGRGTAPGRGAVREDRNAIARTGTVQAGDEGLIPSGARRVPRRDDDGARRTGERHLAAVRSARIAMPLHPPPAGSSSRAASP